MQSLKNSNDQLQALLHDVKIRNFRAVRVLKDEIIKLEISLKNKNINLKDLHDIYMQKSNETFNATANNLKKIKDLESEVERLELLQTDSETQICNLQKALNEYSDKIYNLENYQALQQVEHKKEISTLTKKIQSKNDE